MTYPESMATITMDALESLMKTARAMPEERLTWQPMEVGRNVINQLAECIQVARWFTRIFTERDASFFTPEFIGAQRTERETWTTLADIERDIFGAHEALVAAMRAFPEGELEGSIEFRPGWAPTYRQMCYFPLRNLWYHFGQVNYIQTLYGDKDMH